jgi:hypothetical protein
MRPSCFTAAPIVPKKTAISRSGDVSRAAHVARCAWQRPPRQLARQHQPRTQKEAILQLRGHAGLCATRSRWGTNERTPASSQYAVADQAGAGARLCRPRPWPAVSCWRPAGYPTQARSRDGRSRLFRHTAHPASCSARLSRVHSATKTASLSAPRNALGVQRTAKNARVRAPHSRGQWPRLRTLTTTSTPRLTTVCRRLVAISIPQRSVEVGFAVNACVTFAHLRRAQPVPRQAATCLPAVTGTFQHPRRPSWQL